MLWICALLLTSAQSEIFSDILVPEPRPTPSSPSALIDQGPPRPLEPPFQPPQGICTCVPDPPSVPPLPPTKFTPSSTQYLPTNIYAQSTAPSTAYTAPITQPIASSTQYSPITTYAQPTAPSTRHTAASTQHTAFQTQSTVPPGLSITLSTQAALPPTQNPSVTPYTRPTAPPTRYTASPTSTTAPSTRYPPITTYSQSTPPPTRYTSTSTPLTVPQTQYLSITQSTASPTQYTSLSVQSIAPSTQYTAPSTQNPPETIYAQPTMSTRYTELSSTYAALSSTTPDITTNDGVLYTIARCVTVLDTMANESDQRNRNNANLFRRGARALQLTRNLYFDSYTLRQIEENMRRLADAASQYNSQCRRKSLRPNNYARLNSVFNVNDSWFNPLNLILRVTRLKTVFDGVSTCIEDYCGSDD